MTGIDEAHYKVHVDTRGEHPVVTVAPYKQGTPGETFTIRTVGDRIKLAGYIAHGHTRETPTEELDPWEQPSVDDGEHDDLSRPARPS